MLTEDQVNTIINDQEDAIAELKDKLLAMEDERDLAIGKGLELVSTLKRIECYRGSRDALWAIQEIARTAIEAYQASYKVIP